MSLIKTLPSWLKGGLWAVLIEISLVFPFWIILAPLALWVRSLNITILNYWSIFLNIDEGQLIYKGGWNSLIVTGYGWVIIFSTLFVLGIILGYLFGKLKSSSKISIQNSQGPYLETTTTSMHSNARRIILAILIIVILALMAYWYLPRTPTPVIKSINFWQDLALPIPKFA